MRSLLTLACVAALGMAQAQGDETIVFDRQASPLDADNLDTRAIDFIDLDDDGDLDVFAANFNQTNVAYENDGASNLSVVAIAGLTTAVSRSMDQCLGDFDNDGDTDLFLVNANDQDNELWENLSESNPLATGFALTASPLGTTGGDSYGCAFGELNGDAFLDVVVCNRFQDNELWFGDGTAGGFTQDPVTFAGEANPTRSAVIADIDGDGDNDILFTNSNGLANVVYVNQGGDQLGTIGTFAKAAPDDFSAGGDNSYGLGAADLDGDGDVDLVVSNRNEPNALFENDGSGVFSAVASALANDTGDSYEVSVADWDDDGDADVIFANRVQNNTVFLNVGGLVFEQDVDGQMANERGDSVSVCVGELGVFGDEGADQLDVVFGNTLGGSDFVFVNLGRQWKDLGQGLTGGTTPSMFGNGNLVLNSQASLTTVDAPPNTVTNLVLGATTVSVPFKGGVLVPSPDIVLPPLPTDGSGQQILQGVVSNPLPSVVTLFLQNWIADPSGPQGLTATNAVSVTTL